MKLNMIEWWEKWDSNPQNLVFGTNTYSTFRHSPIKKQAVHHCGCPLFANNYFPSRRGWAYQPDACHLLLQFFSHVGMLLISVGLEPTLARRRVPPLDHEIISGHNYRSQACAPTRKTVGYGQTRGPRTGFEPAISATRAVHSPRVLPGT